MTYEEKLKDEFEGFDWYLLPKFVKRVVGTDKDGMQFAGMAVNIDELLSNYKKELEKKIKKMELNSDQYNDALYDVISLLQKDKENK